MKHILSILIAMTAFMSATAKDDQGHVLTALWKTYEKASVKDMPQEELKALEAIIAEAKEQKLAWDFYDAWDHYVDIQSDINWKKRDEYRKRMDDEVMAFGHSTMIFFHTRAGADYIESHRGEMASEFNPEFYSRDIRINSYTFGAALTKILRSDLDYALWAVGEKPTESYPFDALYELHEILQSESSQEEGLQEFARRYKGKAAGMLAQDRLIRMRFSDLDQSSTKEEEFVALRKDCETLRKEIEQCKGEERIIGECCDHSTWVLNILKSSRVIPDIENGTMLVRFRNSSSARIRLYKDRNRKAVFDKVIRNPKGSFYLEDSVKFELPDLEDGEYSIRLNSDWLTKSYSKHMLSIALRSYGQKHYVYVADAISGRPVKECRLTLYDSNDKAVWKEEGFGIDGFTSLPSSLYDKINKERYGYYLKASLEEQDGQMRCSKDIGLNTNHLPSTVTYSRSAVLLTDRSAFNPGETVRFKAVLYEGGPDLRALGKDIEVEAVLTDPQGKTVERKSLTSNEFSSIDGSFILKKGDRGGSYRISIEKDGRSLAAKYISVDEFILPSFSLIWEKERRSWLPGEEIEFKGRAFSFAGRKLENADISYRISRFGDFIEEGKLQLDPDGNFSIRFRSDSSDNYTFYNLSVKISEFSGETLEFSTGANVSSYISMDASILGSVKGSIQGNGFISYDIVRGESVKVKCISDFPYSYELTKDGKSLLCGRNEGEEFSIDMNKREAGVYRLRLVAGADSEQQLSFFYAPEGMSGVDDDINAFFMELPGELAVLTGSGRGPVWIVAELYGNGNVLLERKLIESEFCKVEFEKKAHYPSELKISLFYFKNFDSYEYSADYRNELSSSSLPLRISRFTDKALPGSRYDISIQTEPGVECAASIFDISSEEIRENRWYSVSPYRIGEINIRTSTKAGSDSSEDMILDDNMTLAYGVRFKSMNSSSEIVNENIETEESSEDKLSERMTFLESLAWEPLLHSNDKGEINLSFKTSDKLSIYAIQLFAHDRQMRNSVLRQEFSVSIPVQINISQPEYLYKGDRYVANIEIQNSSDMDISGRFLLDFGKGSKSRNASIPAGGSWRFSQEIIAEDPGELKLAARFIDSTSSLSDAVSVSIPVKKAAQTLVESHSRLLNPGQDREKIKAELASRLVNTKPETAIYNEISIIDILRKELPEKLISQSDNSIEISGILLSDKLLKKIGNTGTGLSQTEKTKLTEKILACRKADGGFSWFAGMKSSIYVTAALLENFAAMRDELPAELEELIPGAILYMHKECRKDDELYLYIRAMYRDLELPKARIASGTLRKYADETATGTLDKARKVFILKSFGYDKQAERELESLSQYAVSHSSGGVYYPNAVMPWRGLMESELHAHVLLCRILDSYGRNDLAEGIRLWIMIQKETQKWEGDPAFIAAAATVIEGKEETLATKIAILRAEKELDFDIIKENGNGFTIKRSYYLNGKLLKKGDKVKPGDKITARYELWSEENRSFVKLSVPRPAALRAVQQLSGMQGYGRYRSVAADRTDYWFDNYPEEKMHIEEEFYVVQEGSFDAGASTIESLYAPHYRANSDPISQFLVER